MVTRKEQILKALDSFKYVNRMSAWHHDQIDRLKRELAAIEKKERGPAPAVPAEPIKATETPVNSPLEESLQKIREHFGQRAEDRVDQDGVGQAEKVRL